MKVDIVNKGSQPIPEYATEQSAGVDLRANIEDGIEEPESSQEVKDKLLEQMREFDARLQLDKDKLIKELGKNIAIRDKKYNEFKRISYWKIW